MARVSSRPLPTGPKSQSSKPSHLCLCGPCTGQEEERGRACLAPMRHLTLTRSPLSSALPQDRVSAIARYARAGPGANGHDFLLPHQFVLRHLRHHARGRRRADHEAPRPDHHRRNWQSSLFTTAATPVA
eukprot:scaffold965_cov120-Isochrysis_galbana.AAC.16